jgi:hypothetical protein
MKKTCTGDNIKYPHTHPLQSLMLLLYQMTYCCCQRSIQNSYKILNVSIFIVSVSFIYHHIYAHSYYRHYFTLIFKVEFMGS